MKKNAVLNSIKMASTIFFTKMFSVLCYAAEDMGGLTIDSGSNFTIKPGKYPSLNGSLEDTVSEANLALSKFSHFLFIVIAICGIVLLGFLIINMTKFAKSGDNDREREVAKKNLLWSLIAISLLGSISIILSLANTLGSTIANG